MKSVFLGLLTLYAFNAAAAFQAQSWEPQIEHAVTPVVERFDELAETQAGYQLARIDLDFSLSAELGVLFFSKEKEKGIELVWERRETKASEEVTDVVLTTDTEAVVQQMLPPVLEILSQKKASNRLREKIIKRLYRDAKEMNSLVQNLARFNGSESWYVANYFKLYHFSVDGDLVFAGASYDKRLRFRFRTPSVMHADQPLTRKQRRLERRLRKLARHLESVAKQDGPEHRFQLSRVRSIESLRGGLDASVASASAGKGILLEWLPLPESQVTKWVRFPLTPSALRATATALENAVPDSRHFELSQIRLKNSRDSELSFLFLSVTRSRDIEYHYRRRP